MKGLSVSPDGTAVAQTGNLLGDLAQGLWDQGQRALPHGTCPYVGIGGHASFGGYGFFSRKAGLLLDTVQSAEVVLANGTLTTASATQNPDLFWALRGAGPSFGIVTAWTFATLAAPPVVIDFEINFGAFVPENLTAALISYQAFGSTAPREISMQAVLGPSNGGIYLSFDGDYYGSLDDFHSIFDPWVETLPSFERNVSATSMNWIDAQVAKDGDLSTSSPEPHDTFFAKSLLISEPSTNASLSAWVNYLFDHGISPATNWFVEIDMWGGAIADPPSTSTSFAHRDAIFGYQFYASSKNGAPPYPSSGFSFLNEMVATLNNGNLSAPAYPNYIDPTLSPNESHVAYYGTGFSRLSQIKSAFDPENLFSSNQSIPLSVPPSTTSSAPQETPTSQKNSSPHPTAVHRRFIEYIILFIFYIIFDSVNTFF
ncbi:hypothetical protein SISSUDRAFT_212157 [Sistotremastrum suecicum HHB10207 ss-3]|uniref:FAD-binding PCMH-type domain-containing protein n=1 Tax=Sistotremastrum suecicum HHB10207 ss-3 TaxID=1314776 RepID=A0A166A8X2_9AGAM|nr:hypothetical protein SISSUDRAFT_212157 [Sistotremastrum suecicum HHB10207 ss-3]